MRKPGIFPSTKTERFPYNNEFRNQSTKNKKVKSKRIYHSCGRPRIWYTLRLHILMHSQALRILWTCKAVSYSPSVFSVCQILFNSGYIWMCMESFGKSNASRINDLGCHFRILRSGWLLTFTTALMDFLDPIRRFADATTARVKRRNATQRNANVACLRLPFTVCTKFISLKRSIN
jgi:hypothetical protein